MTGRALTTCGGGVFKEDPEEDMRYLDLGADDSMLVITSAGDNALHYAIAAQPKRVGGVSPERERERR